VKISGDEGGTAIPRDLVEDVIRRDRVETAMHALAKAGFIELEGPIVSLTELGRADVAKRRAEGHSLWQGLNARWGPSKNDQNLRNAVLDTIAFYALSK
jgi:hypothetical protein